ncbi:MULTISPECIES: plasmid mobilization protein [Castellaniella]|uniref:plasmid mobilization protein n=1 Tax=Castellaniella TaxID=359336 RepID=UPI0039C3FB89
MNEPLSEVIRIRVTSSHAARLGDAAALSGLSLSNYVRRRLMADDTLQEELTLLRQIVADLGQLRDTRMAAVETVHLVRAMAKPEQIAIAEKRLIGSF